MKVKGSQMLDKFSISPIPNKEGWFLCRFTENAHEYHDEDSSGWEYDEYRLEQHGLEQSIVSNVLGNYDVFLKAAKATEAPTETEKLRADLDYVMIMGDFV